MISHSMVHQTGDDTSTGLVKITKKPDKDEDVEDSSPGRPEIVLTQDKSKPKVSKQAPNITVELDEDMKIKAESTAKTAAAAAKAKEDDWDKNHIKMLMELCADDVAKGDEAVKKDFIAKFKTEEGRRALDEECHMSVKATLEREWDFFYLHEKDPNTGADKLDAKGNPIRIEPALLCKKITYEVNFEHPPGVPHKIIKEKTVYTSVSVKNPNDPKELTEATRRANQCGEMFAGIVTSAIHSKSGMELNITQITNLANMALLQITSSLFGGDRAAGAAADKSELSKRMCVYFGADNIDANKPDVTVSLKDLVWKVHGVGPNAIYNPASSKNVSAKDETISLRQIAERNVLVKKGAQLLDGTPFVDPRRNLQEMDRLDASKIDDELAEMTDAKKNNIMNIADKSISRGGC